MHICTLQQGDEFEFPSSTRRDVEGRGEGGKKGLKRRGKRRKEAEEVEEDRRGEGKRRKRAGRGCERSDEEQDEFEFQSSASDDQAPLPPLLPTLCFGPRSLSR